MAKLNPIERSKFIANQYKTYLQSSFRFDKDSLQKLFEEQLQEENLFKGPYVSLELPFQRGESIQELVEEGTLCRSFLSLGDINFTRPLYSHQEEAIRLIGKGHSAVITTGTGSGKTECFLYPIINSILTDLESGNHDIGIRAIFLYPMNALVNDQVDRVRRILKDCPDITFGFFTGDTEDTVPQNYRETYEEENEIFIPQNELVSREEMRQNPPHLLFTNYSMLEYLMIRPNDYALFTPERLRNWKYVVLDEAHTYYGSLGIEISMLMRRVTAMADKKPQFILTSATLGEEGKSEKEIVEFAQNLTATHFEQSDIIFSKRIPLLNTVEYAISGSDYVDLYRHMEEMDFLRGVCSKYDVNICTNSSAALYELLCRDEHTHQLCAQLKNGTKNFHDLVQNLRDLEENELIALIDLINGAEKNGIGLFDLKYHSFVRPLSGAYVTLTDPPALSLSKTNSIGEFKAFELGNCRYCNASYLIGKIHHSTGNHLDYLVQNQEIDIYENYGENEFANLDYFMLSNRELEEEVSDTLLEEYTLCVRCGAVYQTDNLNARKCDCDDSYKRIIYHARQTTKSDDSRGSNNILQCPCCKHRSASGVVKSLNLGKDEGTAIIAQTLYDAIDEGEDVIQEAHKLSLVLGDNKATSIPRKAKQFLSFSDSRQQASFAAVFMDETYSRILRKRLIWKVFEDNSFGDISVNALAASLTEIIKSNELFSENMDSHKNAWVALLADLLKLDGDYDGEGLGLYYFDLDLSSILGQIDEKDVEVAFGKYDLSKNDLATLMQVVLEPFKTAPAINYTKSTLTPDEKREYLGYRRFDNSIQFFSPKALKNVRSFLPVRGNENKVIRYIEKICACDSKEAKDFLDVIFNNLAVAGDLLTKQGSKNVYQIDAGKYIAKSYVRNKYYRCSKCGRLTPYNVHNICPQDKCTGKLMEVDPDEALKDNYYRNQYKTRKIENIVIKEHTAQLSRQKAKQYQKDFKDQKINILSCSTTFEMGVDIGELETVFMRNIPPTPANYVQRAGRAGRRKSSSAYILTYCGANSHDYTYFEAPEKMISGIIMPPHFNILNDKIVVRHLMASCLGFFFREYPEYFKSIGSFVFSGGVDDFSRYLQNNPKDLLYYINERVLPESTFEKYHSLSWIQEMGDDVKLKHFVEEMCQTKEELEKAQEECLQDQNFKEADYYQKLLKKLYEGRLLDALSQYCVIPKYGFPIDVVDLKTYDENGRPIDTKQFEKNGLSRDLKIAISEYAPDSEVIVDKKKYTSKYVALHKKFPLPKHYFCICPKCKKINVYLDKNLSNCKFCGEPIGAVGTNYYIEPVYGFKTGLTKESSRKKPKRSYAGEVEYLGGGIIDQHNLQIGNSMFFETSSESELLVLNKFDFYMCPICGYSDIDRSRSGTPHKTVVHKDSRQYPCPGDELEHLKIGHSFKTDVTRVMVPDLTDMDPSSYAKALSFMYAFLEGISNALEIERNDIGGLLQYNLDEGSWDIILYDDVPGGAGHVKRLMDRMAVEKSLKAALVKVSQDCCDENTSCYNCLRNYYNQSHHALLRRIYAKEIIEGLLAAMGE